MPQTKPRHRWMRRPRPSTGPLPRRPTTRLPPRLRPTTRLDVSADQGESDDLGNTADETGSADAGTPTGDEHAHHHRHAHAHRHARRYVGRRTLVRHGEPGRRRCPPYAAPAGIGTRWRTGRWDPGSGTSSGIGSTGGRWRRGRIDGARHGPAADRPRGGPAGPPLGFRRGRTLLAASRRIGQCPSVRMTSPPRSRTSA